MRVITGMNNIDAMIKLYAAVKAGVVIKTRGQECRNVQNLAIILDGRRAPITGFEGRKLNLKYAKEEWLWYVRADPKDASIMEHATMWKKLQQADGSFYSNYGQYVFGPDLGTSQFAYAVKCLREDRQSRRASIMLLKREHLFTENTDTVCTYAINFTIVKNRLDMTVMMRSNDVIFGFTNDAFCFWNLMLLVHSMLKDAYPELEMGNYTHFANSMHVYDRHYQMIEMLVRRGEQTYRLHDVPAPSKDETLEFLRSKGQDGNSRYASGSAREPRPEKDQYFLQMATLVSRRATCHRRQVGCVLVNEEGHVLAMGYNGVYSGAEHCEGDTKCPGADLPSGEGLHLCQAIHAEQNALIQCRDITEIHTIYVTASPCVQCMRLIRNTSAKRIVFAEEYPHGESALIARRGRIIWAKYKGGGTDVPELPGSQQDDGAGPGV